MHPALQRLLSGRERTLLDLSSFFDRLDEWDRAMWTGKHRLTNRSSGPCPMPVCDEPTSL